jgi:phospholipid/cholesterol/gamma-HCH transport system substrate-binding protein
MRSRRIALPTALAALAASAALSGCGLSLQQLPKLGKLTNTYPLRADFADVLNLPSDAQVREGAQVVGQVGGERVSNFQADLVLNIRRSVQIPTGTVAQVRFDNPLGEEYILLTPPAAPSGSNLAPNAILTLADTGTAPTVEDTLGALATVLNGGAVGQIGTIVHELNRAFSGRQPQIRQLISQIDLAVRSFNGSSSSIDGALNAISNLAAALNAGRATLTTGLDTIGPAIGVLANENGQFSQLLSAFHQLTTTASAVATQSGQNTVTAIKSLLPVVQQVVGVEQQLGPDLGDLSAFEALVPKLAPSNYLQVAVTADVVLPKEPSNVTVAAANTGIAALLEGGLP